jgi:hypothetical protein
MVKITKQNSSFWGYMSLKSSDMTFVHINFGTKSENKVMGQNQNK